jgi:hypothetical protein
MLSVLGILVRICQRRCSSIKHFSLFIIGMCPVHVVNSAFVESLIFLSSLKKKCICVYTVSSSVVEKALSNDVNTGIVVACVSVFRTHIPRKLSLVSSLFS